MWLRMTPETPEKSDRQIGRELGVDNKTVASRRGFLEAGEEIPHLDTTTGADGKQFKISFKIRRK